jgi:nucleoside-triphosphatase
VKTVCLLTGPPGCGKTTLIKQIVGEYHGRACGFYTEELREGSERSGFRLVTLDGKSAVLSSIHLKSPYRIGKYGVDLDALESVGVSALENHGCDLTVIDEIGKMELLSLRFREEVMRIIVEGRRMLGTVLFHHHTWSDTIKARSEVRLIMLNRANYSEVLGEVRKWLETAP